MICTKKEECRVDGQVSALRATIAMGLVVTRQLAKKAEVAAAAAAMGEWDRRHGWLHSPEGRAADAREAEQGVARVVAALRVWPPKGAGGTWCGVGSGDAGVGAGFLCH